MSENAKYKLDLLYQEVFNAPSKIKNGCGRCQLESLKKLGEAFFSYQKELETKVVVPNDDEIIPVEETKEEIIEKPKKKGRPKKNS